ncbi:hypothetical protein [Sporosarcina sp. ITBMC105]
MAYGPVFKKTAFQGGKNILASEHLQYIEGGATLDHTKFAKGYNEVGQIIARNTTTGKFEPYVESVPGTLESGFDNFAVLNEDFTNDYDQDLIVGEVIVRGSVYEAKLPQAVPATFKAANPMIRYVNHV